MTTLIKTFWYRRLRSIDITVLWPMMKTLTKDLDTARMGFKLHTQSDRAWQFVGDQETDRIISALT